MDVWTDDFCLELGIRLKGNHSLWRKIVTKTHAFLRSEALKKPSFKTNILKKLILQTHKF